MVRRPLAAFIAVLTVLLCGSAVAAPRVVASVLPVQSLVAAVMAGAGEPALLIPPGASPHDYALRPSDAQRLREAAVVVWVGATLEPSLSRVVAGLDRRTRVITLLTEPRLRHLGERRSGDRIEPLGGGSVDPHVWLDPENAIAILRVTAETLAKADPAEAALYRRNAAAAEARIRALEARMEAELAPVRNRPYLAFHDAYQYLEARYGLRNLGFVVPHPEHPMTGARHVRTLRTLIRRDGIRCIFTEPEYEPKLINPVVEGLPVRVMTLDHLGASLPQGPDLYGRMMERLVHDLASCLARSGRSS